MSNFCKCFNVPNINIVKKHINLDYLIESKDLEYVIIPIRKNKKNLFISAYFSDIIEDSYEYSPFNRCLKKFRFLKRDDRKELINIIDIDILVDDFKLIDWTKYEWLNPYKLLDILNDGFDYNVNIDELETIQIVNAKRRKDDKNIKIIFVATESLTKETMMTITNELDVNYNKSEYKLINSNNGSQKWYNDRFIKFKDLYNNSN